MSPKFYLNDNNTLDSIYKQNKRMQDKQQVVIASAQKNYKQKENLD
jgi:hypothetical protein